MTLSPNDMQDREVDEGTFANVIGALLGTIKGTGKTVIDGMHKVGPLTPTTDYGIGNPDAQGTPFQKLSGTPVASGGNTGDEANPVQSGDETISQPFGNGHPGIDIGVPVGTTLVSAINGTVTNASNSDPNGYGNMVEITGANGIAVRYGHLSYIGTKVGDQVKAGQPIGKSGGDPSDPNHGNSTGPHLHFEVDQNGSPIDPSHFLAIKGNGIVAGMAGDAAPVAAAPGRTVSQADATATADSRLLAAIGGKGDPGSENTTSPIASASQSSTGTATSGADSDPNALGAFLNATKQHESGGNYQARYSGPVSSDAAGAYQFLSSTWQGAGGSTASAADASPAEQDAVASRMAMQLFNQFHSWRLVAIAWYGGPGIAEQVAQGQNPGSPSGQGSYIEYGNTIANMMSGGK